MITERSAKLVELLRYKEQLTENAGRGAAFQSRQEEIAGHVGDLGPKVAAVKALRARAIQGLDATSHVTPLLQRITSMRGSFDEDPSWIIDNDRFNPNPFRGNLRGLHSTLDAHISQAWTHYTEERMPPISEDLLNLFGMIPDFVPTVRKVRDLLAKINTRRNKRLPDEQDFVAFDALIEEVEEEWKGLRSDNLPGSVMRFLRSSAGREGAPLSSLTPEVTAWLTERGIVESFHIRMLSRAV